MTSPARTTSWMLILGVALFAGATMQACEFHVGQAGHDGNPGTSDRPFATVQAAQRAARASLHTGPVTVWLHEGVYYLPQTLRFTVEDSGSTYAALPTQTVVLSGGTRLQLEWEPWRDGIMKASTPQRLWIDQLFVDGKQQIAARYPDYVAGARPFGGTSEDSISKDRAGVRKGVRKGVTSEKVSG